MTATMQVIHAGDNTHHQDQSITPAILSIINNKIKQPTTPKPRLPVFLIILASSFLLMLLL